jgi:hypothetical protein
MALVRGGADILSADNHGNILFAERKLEVAKYLLQHFYATIIRRLPLHQLLKELTWIGNPFSGDAPPLGAALHRDVLGMDDVVEIIEYLVG